MLDSLTTFARDAVTVLGYPGIFIAMVVENVFPPIPSEVVLPLAGFEASKGGLSFVPTVLVATAGSVAGALILYALGRYGGRPVVLRWGRVLRVGEAELDRSQVWFDRFGDWVVFGARVVPLARSVVSIPAGTMRMALPRFVLLTTLGSLAWNVMLVGAGYLLGSRWQEVSRLVGRYSDVMVVIVALALVTGVFLLLRRRRTTST